MDGRGRRMAVLYHEHGLTLDGIGQLYGVTRERVRQILDEYGRPSQMGGPPVRRAQRQAALAARVDQARGEIVALYRAGRRIDEIVVQLGLPAKDVSRVVDEVLGVEREAIRGRKIAASKPRVSEEEMLASLRRAAKDMGEAFTTDEFAAWAKKHGVIGPQTVHKRFGSWNEARRRAGLPVMSRHPREPRSDMISERDCLAAVLGLAAELGRTPSAQEYERSGRRPTVSTIRTRFGSWGRARRLADAEFRGGDV